MCMEHEDGRAQEPSQQVCWKGQFPIGGSLDYSLRKKQRSGAEGGAATQGAGTGHPSHRAVIRYTVSPGTLLKAAVSRVKRTEEQDGATKMASRIKVFAAKPDYLRSVPRTARRKEKTVTSCSLAFML